jgi:hypothetical protein
MKRSISCFQERKKGTAQEEEPDDQLIGRKAETSRIRNMLLGGGAACQVIVVSGVAGVGKTALVGSIYHSRDIKRRFPGRAWANASQPLDREALLTSLALQLQLKNPPSPNIVDIVISRSSKSCSAASAQTSEQVVQSSLQSGKRNLIVVDGLSSVTELYKEAGDILAQANEAKWNRIIVITRETEENISVENNIVVVVVKCLKYADAFRLFKTKVCKRACIKCLKYDRQYTYIHIYIIVHEIYIFICSFQRILNQIQR